MNKINDIRILVVCKKILKNEKLHQYPIAEFIYEQNLAIEKLGVVFDYYLVERKGILGYLYHTWDFLKYINEHVDKYNIIHAHGGHIGTLVNIIAKIPVITTYHGSDINYTVNRLFSCVSLLKSRRNIFVSYRLYQKVKWFTKGVIIPCGVDFKVFRPLNKSICRKALGLDLKHKIILFAGQRSRKVKNYVLAKKAFELCVADEIIELEGLRRNSVVQMLNACDCILLTSYHEGSPTIIKEALACNRPVVSVDVGDVKEISNDIDGVNITNYNPLFISQCITKAFQYKSINSRQKIKYLENHVIAHKVYRIYCDIIKGI